MSVIAACHVLILIAFFFPKLRRMAAEKGGVSMKDAAATENG